MFEKFKAWFKRVWEYDSGKDSRDAHYKEIDDNKKENKRISTGLDKFKYRTLYSGYNYLKIWKEGFGSVMKLETDEANQLLIYLQFATAKKVEVIPSIPKKNLNGSNKDNIRQLAMNNGYTELKTVNAHTMVSFKKGGVRLNVFHTTMTVGTCLDHPKSGKTQLFRKKVSLELLDKLFKNPRFHTDKGYHKK